MTHLHVLTNLTQKPGHSRSHKHATKMYRFSHCTDDSLASPCWRARSSHELHEKCGRSFVVITCDCSTLLRSFFAGRGHGGRGAARAHWRPRSVANPRVLPGMKKEAAVMVRKFVSDTLKHQKRVLMAALAKIPRAEEGYLPRVKMSYLVNNNVTFQLKFRSGTQHWQDIASPSTHRKQNAHAACPIRIKVRRRRVPLSR